MADIKFAEAQGDDTQTELRAEIDRTRDDMQHKIDSRVSNLYDRWVKAGHPKPANAPFDRLTVAKGDVAALKAMIRRAQTGRKDHPHKLRVLFFKDKADANGTVTVKYTVSHPKPASNGQAEAPKADQPK